MYAEAVTQHGAAPGFIECQPVLDTVPKSLEANGGVVSEKVCQLWIAPAIMLQLQGKREVPVIKCNPGRDMMRQQRIDQIGIKAQPLRIRFAATRGLETRP